MPGTLVIRADAGPQIGVGHVLRCMALAGAWRRAGGRTVFVTHRVLGALADRLRAGGHHVLSIGHRHPHPDDLRQTEKILAEQIETSPTAAPVWVAVDGYHFDPPYLQAVRRAGGRLVVIDDLARFAGEADVVVSTNAACESLHGPAGRRVLLIGPQYVLLRWEFLAERKRPRIFPPRARRVLITFGGADPDDVTGLVLDALAGPTVEDLQVVVVAGPAYQHKERLARRAARSGGALRLVSNTWQIHKLMTWADVAVAAAGTTAWELACLGVPMALVVIADNQRPTASLLSAAGAAICLGEAGSLRATSVAEALGRLCEDRRQRIEQSTSARRLVDGRGAERVVAVLRALAGDLSEEHWVVRPATHTDMRPLWQLANEPSVRQMSLRPDPIPQEAHRRWFRRRLADPRCCLWVLECAGLIAGQIRYDAQQNSATVSISVTQAFRGRGLGTRLLHSTWREACRRLAASRLVATIRSDNQPSRRLFARAGFQLARVHYHRGHQWLVMEKTVAAWVAQPPAVATPARGPSCPFAQ